MKKLLLACTVTIMAGCVSTPVDLERDNAPYSKEELRAAQAEVLKPQKLALKRKVAVARLSNETTYGKSLLSDDPEDRVAEKVSDMFLQGLINSGNYLIFERPDINALADEAELTGQELDLIGVDTLIVGSLTEFGRVTTGEAGFISSKKKQEATATIDLRLVDAVTGQVLSSITGTGAASTETSNTMGFGNVAGYDGSINDRAIGAAVNAAIAKLDNWMLEKKWTSDVLADDNGMIIFAGGASQGITPGMEFVIETRGRKVKSATTGGTITLPGNKVAEVRVVSTFGDTELEEGSISQILTGNIDGYELSNLVVKEKDQ
ncbi:CsgG/HfaB family protein [Salinibius halmophilus]|uniref:CsgG/HfaB family protein n=1 Tax=Salinibius halmophilus TaxID=1853216 RepID=UPI000E667FB4|nr:CsgG/HfaB family protein [Salinibius halmophilus]